MDPNISQETFIRVIEKHYPGRLGSLGEAERDLVYFELSQTSGSAALLIDRADLQSVIRTGSKGQPFITEDFEKAITHHKRFYGGQ